MCLQTYTRFRCGHSEHLDTLACPALEEVHEILQKHGRRYHDQHIDRLYESCDESLAKRFLSVRRRCESCEEEEEEGEESGKGREERERREVRDERDGERLNEGDERKMEGDMGKAEREAEEGKMKGDEMDGIMSKPEKDAQKDQKIEGMYSLVYVGALRRLSNLMRSSEISRAKQTENSMEQTSELKAKDKTTLSANGDEGTQQNGEKGKQEDATRTGTGQASPCQNTRKSQSRSPKRKGDADGEGIDDGEEGAEMQL